MTAKVWEVPETTEWLAAHHPFRGFGEAQDLANAILFLASEENTWMTGATMVVDGGFNAM